MPSTNRTISEPISPPNRVREIRKIRNMTLTELSARIGMAHGHLAKIERGLRDLNHQWSVRIARELSVLPADLMTTGDGGLTDTERRIIDTYRRSPESWRVGYLVLCDAHNMALKSEGKA
ncbi:XRE family transcriptional regulator [Croceicoccus ponticola]|uniref:XRE family transcriptional regulator n=1 Tax=Croceicoccus ponticola TaxID=2217664 RepID=A0A437GYA4_9SPHN|nr:helix-turn-helix transcriptional regulator [Croceicoccus ponticola]RVQ67674.1 XRE family transcriptional regulator [Croceicoccus ponticola]